jgi:hypothetical protein
MIGPESGDSGIRPRRDDGAHLLMAIMIPDTCPSKATDGEKRVYSLIRDALPNNFIGWYEPVIQGRYPDFTLLADDFGLLVLEVKGWYLGSIASANDQNVEYRKVDDCQTQIISYKNPIIQARDYYFRAIDELSRLSYAILHQSDGEHRGKLRFPGGYGVIFTNITRANLDESGFSTLFPPDRVLCRDELTALATAGDHAVIRRLRMLFPAPFAFDPLTEDQVKTIRGAIHREVRNTKEILEFA